MTVTYINREVKGLFRNPNDVVLANGGVFELDEVADASIIAFIDGEIEHSPNSGWTRQAAALEETIAAVAEAKEDSAIIREPGARKSAKAKK